MSESLGTLGYSRLRLLEDNRGTDITEGLGMRKAGFDVQSTGIQKHYKMAQKV